jgi:hypothetical protein
MKPTQVHGEVVVLQADDDGGLFEGRSEAGHRLRRFGGYGLLEVTSEEAKQLRSADVSDEVKQGIIYGKFELTDPNALSSQDSYGLQRLVGGACMNVIQVLPDSPDGYRVNPHKAVHAIKEYPRPVSAHRRNQNPSLYMPSDTNI